MRCNLNLYNYENIKLLFADFLAQSTTELSDSERAEIREYVDVGEYGIALRTAIGIFCEERKSVTASERSLLSQLAVAMSIDPEPLLRRLTEAQGQV